MRVALSSVEAVFRPSDALRPQRGQMFAVQVSMASVRLLNWTRCLCNLLTRSTRFLTLRPRRSKNESKRYPGGIMDRRDFLKTATTAVGIATTEQLLTPMLRAEGKTRSEEHTSELQSLRHLVC